MILAAPTPASFSVMQYSPASSTIVLVNQSNFPAYLQPNIATWTWSGSAWVLTNAGLANNPTPLRSDTSGAYDTTGSQLIIFGGRGQPGLDFINDVWGYSAGETWSQLVPNYNDIGLSIGTISTSVNNSTYPPTVVQSNIDGTTGLCIRARSYMFALSTGVLLHGGFDRHYIYQDTYQFASGSWSTLSPTNIPPIRVGACAASDGSSNAILAFGANNSFMLNDNWLWTVGSGNWTQLTTNTPPSVRRDATMAWYPTGGYFLLFGGQDTAGNTLGQTWTLSLSGDTGTWTQLTPANSPSRRIGASMAYDASSSQMLLFGGADSKNIFGDTWQWTGTNWVNLLNPIATY
jgi:hypothetical protein